MKTINSIPFLALCLLMFVGCEKSSSNNKRPNSGLNPVALPNSPTPLPNNTVLSNCNLPPSIDDVPTNWTDIDADQLITGQNTHYQFLKSESFVSHVGESTMLHTLYEDGQVSIKCADMRPNEMTRFQYMVLLSFSAKNGEFTRYDGTNASVVSLMFDVRNTDDVMTLQNIRHDSYTASLFNGVFSNRSFADNIASPDALGKPQSRFYRLPNGEVEIRLTKEINLAGEGSAKIVLGNLTIINRYKVR